MMSYIAFKSLRVCSDGVYSPHRYTKWDEVYAPALGRLTYSLRTASLEGNQGVYAGTFSEAWFYMMNDCRMFLLAPDPDAETEVGTMGWRTTCAIVLGEVTSLHDTARLILASRQAGYPQIREILRWAHLMDVMPRKGLTARELVEQSVEVRRMIRAAAMGQHVAIRRGRGLVLVGVTWSTPIRVINGDQVPVLGRYPPPLHKGGGGLAPTEVAMPAVTPSQVRIGVLAGASTPAFLRAASTPQPAPRALTGQGKGGPMEILLIPP